jgi:hypothetical protein
VIVNERHCLPDRRRSENLTLEVGGLRYTATASWYPGGKLGALLLHSALPSNTATIFQGTCIETIGSSA